ncbi:SDR family NAD(P)-dependent oxidoreductase [Shimia ponticola]|uniref:SDR family NAD(P)-dependent oxidoreductase n=1 Tax=Shimia ponticola TaxID=2582893 RepID=UPI0011BD6D47|nr:SDR family NAD(P)-dependent oxidoreductase [Shimia ponticola]
MKNVLVIGASGGIGSAFVAELGRRGAAVTGMSRSADGLDMADAASIERVLGALPGDYDGVIVATGKLDGAGNAPEKSLKALEAEAMLDQFQINCVGPAMVLKLLPSLLTRDEPSWVGVLSARVGSIGDNGLGGWYSYRTAKAALNQMVHGAAIEIARTHPQAILAALHPGTVATQFTSGFTGRDKLEPAQSAARLIDVLSGLGPQDSGTFRDWKGEVVPW